MKKAVKDTIINIFIIVGLIFILAGCQTTPEKPQTVTKVETTVIKIPEVWLTNCEISPPPDPDKYVVSSVQEKEDILANYNIELLKEIETCNTRFKAINVFQTNSAKLLQETKQ